MSERELRDLIVQGEAERQQMRAEIAALRQRNEELYRDRRELFELLRSAAMESISARELFVSGKWSEETSYALYEGMGKTYRRALEIGNKGAGD